ncbi:MAG: acyltransferase [Rhodocyclaceae bacterium]|nr:acyltransferase [Rhodocyclaceae bacterium]
MKISNKYRIDIQALRGIAVLLVVLHHANIDLFEAGYLGVDIFFVVSGFLITGLVADGIDGGSFSFSKFYFRRAKRLLPAAYTVVLATTAIAPFVLGGVEINDLAAQVLGAITFTANIVLWQQVDYFAGSAELKPLLHVWSLSLEEQFYFILPALLVFLPRRYWLRSLAILLVASLVVCFVGVVYKPVATFYLLPTRAWELAVGAVGALVADNNRVRFVAKLFVWPALAGLFLVPAIPTGGVHPGIDALLVCIATFVLLLYPENALCRGPLANALAKVGDMSYSLYLVHWPIFAFANNAWVGNSREGFSVSVTIVLVAISFILSYLLYRFVEAPIHRSSIGLTRSNLLRTTTCSALLVVAPYVVANSISRSVDFEDVRKANHGLNRICSVNESFEVHPECRSADSPALAVWGDSYAMHLVQGLLSMDTDSLLGIEQVTMSACGPMLDLAPVDKTPGSYYNRYWAAKCLEFQRKAVKHLAESASVKIVVMSSPFVGYLKPDAFDNLVSDGSEMTLVEPTVDRAVASLRRSVDYLRSAGKRVVIVAPPPTGGFDTGSCLERLVTEKIRFGAPSDCRIPLAAYHHERAKEREFLTRVEKEKIADVVWLDPFLCDERSCVTMLDNELLYRDAGHLTYRGSELVAARMGLLDRVVRLAH